MWRGFDVELDEYCRVAATPLLEMPLDFPPSYMRKEQPAQEQAQAQAPAPAPPVPSSGGEGGAADEGRETAQGGPAPAETLAYEGKRCPSWCDLAQSHDEPHSKPRPPPYYCPPRALPHLLPPPSRLPTPSPPPSPWLGVTAS